MAGGAPADFTQAGAARDDGAGIGAVQQGRLQQAILLIREEFCYPAGKNGCFNNDHWYSAPEIYANDVWLARTIGGSWVARGFIGPAPLSPNP